MHRTHLHTDYKKMPQEAHRHTKIKRSARGMQKQTRCLLPRSLRLKNAPTTDYQGVLGPNYKSPFSGQVNAWVRLLPYHVLLNDDDSISKEEWDQGISTLCEKYREQSLHVRKKVDHLSDVGPDFVVEDVPGLGSGLLSDVDSIVMETVMLEDVYETVRREKAIAEKRARELAQRRAMEAEAARKAEEQTARAAEAARQAAAQSTAGNVLGGNAGRMPLMGNVGANVFGHGPASNSGTAGVASSGSQTFDAGRSSGVAIGNHIGMHGQVGLQGGNYQANASRIPGLAMDKSVGGLEIQQGYQGQVGREQMEQAQAGGVKNFGATAGQNSSGLSAAFENARQAAMVQGSGLPLGLQRQYGSQAQGVVKGRLMDQSWAGHSGQSMSLAEKEILLNETNGANHNKGLGLTRGGEENVVNGKSSGSIIGQGDGGVESKDGIGIGRIQDGKGGRFGEGRTVGGNGRMGAEGNQVSGNDGHDVPHEGSKGNNGAAGGANANEEPGTRNGFAGFSSALQSGSGDVAGQAAGPRRPGMMSLPGGRGIGVGHVGGGSFGGGTEEGSMGMESLLNAEGR